MEIESRLSCSNEQGCLRNSRMSALCLHRFIRESSKQEYNCFFRYFSLLLTQAKSSRTLPQARLMIAMAMARTGPMAQHAKSLCTASEEGKEDSEGKKKKPDPNTRKTFGSIGRKIHHRIIHVIDENKQNLGAMHRADVIRLMDERELKLVPLQENADPPVYGLMTGKQIHEEQLRLKEKQKASSKAGPVQVKELTFSACIAKHDLETKTKQIQQWIEKKHQVRITVQKGSTSDGADKLAVLEQIADSMPGKATCVYKPKLIREGKAAMCVLRHMSEKELNEYKKQKGLQDSDSSGEAEAPQPNKLPK